MSAKKIPVKRVRTKKVAKKTTKKKVAKKATKKVAKKATKKTTKKATKKTTKKAAKKASKKKGLPLVYAENHKSFWTSDGQVLNSLIALRDALEGMDSYVYEYHSEGSDNDFAKWVEVVLCDEDCAAALRRSRTQKGATTVVVTHLKRYAV